MSDPLKLPSWEQYGYHAMSEMERFSKVLDTVAQQVDKLEKRQVAGEARTRLIGSIFGFCAAALVEAGRVIISMVKGH